MEDLLKQIKEMKAEIAILKEHRVEQDLLSHIVSLRERVTALESSATQ